MKKVLICLLLVLSLLCAVACQHTPPDITPDPAENNETSNTLPYIWNSISFADRKTSGISFKAEDTELSPYTFAQFKNGETPFNGVGGFYHMFEYNVSGCCVEYRGEKISLDSTEFSFKVGGGAVNDLTISPLEEKYGVEVDAMSITLTIDGVTHTVVEPIAIQDLYSDVPAAQISPIFDAQEGKVVYISRHFNTLIRSVNVPLSLFDFSDKNCIEVTVNAPLHAGDDVLPESFAPCTFQLYKTADGYEFVGTDPTVEGYRVTISQNCCS